MIVGVHIPEMMENPLPTQEFVDCFNAAGSHLHQAGMRCAGGIQMPDRRIPPFRWIKAVPYGPYLEHLSFFLGGQAFFVQLVDESMNVIFEGTPEGLAARAAGYNGMACLLPMRRRPSGSSWEPAYQGWGLLDARTREPLDPMRHLVTPPTPMTDWEMYDFAIEQVVQKLKEQNRDILSWSTDPDIEPSLFFHDGSQRAYCVVRPYMFGERIKEYIELKTNAHHQLAGLGIRGYYAPVVFKNLEQQDDGEVLPIYREIVCDVECHPLIPMEQVYGIIRNGHVITHAL